MQVTKVSRAQPYTMRPRDFNPFVPTVPTCAVRQQMLELSCENATVGTNGLKIDPRFIDHWKMISLDCCRMNKYFGIRFYL